MSTPIWILFVLAAAVASAVVAFSMARRGAPTRKQLADLQGELEAAREQAQQVQGRVTEHFERSALLFGQLAKDYKAFLDHYSDSAQALGLSERRARELIEQGYQPLLTHLEPEPGVPTAAADLAAAETVATESAAGKAASEEPVAETVPEASAPEAVEPVKVVEVDLDVEPSAVQQTDRRVGQR